MRKRGFCSHEFCQYYVTKLRKILPRLALGRELGGKNGSKNAISQVLDSQHVIVFLPKLVMENRAFGWDKGIILTFFVRHLSVIKTSVIGDKCHTKNVNWTHSCLMTLFPAPSDRCFYPFLRYFTNSPYSPFVRVFHKNLSFCCCLGNKKVAHILPLGEYGRTDAIWNLIIFLDTTASAVGRSRCLCRPQG